MARTCPFCNRDVKETDKWCPWCGKKLSDASADMQAPVDVDTYEPMAYTPPSAPPTTMTELPMPEEQAIEQYLIRAKIEKMNEKLHEAKEKINDYLGKIESQGGDLSDEDIGDLKNLVAKIKSKRDELIVQKIDLPLHENIVEIPPSAW